MTNLEMVEKLREKADVSFEEAKDALERANWDLLDAIVLLEREGKVNAKAAAQGAPAVAVELTTTPYSTKSESGAAGEQHKNPTFGETMEKFFRWVGKVLERANMNQFVMEKKGEKVGGVSVTVAVLLLVFCFWVVIPLLIIGLFCGLRYKFEGPDLGKDSINSVMGKATDAADSVKSEIGKMHKNNAHKYEACNTCAGGDCSKCTMPKQ